MARFSPVRSQCQFGTPGERRFAKRLEKLLETITSAGATLQSGPWRDIPTSSSCTRAATSSCSRSRTRSSLMYHHGKVTLHTGSGPKTVAILFR